jgi:DHA2 family multidrug resistance protein-like MFS transporter
MSTTRQVSTALGVGVIGSILVSGYHSALATRTNGLGLSHSDLVAARDSLGAARTVAHQLGGVSGRTLDAAARSAFVHGMHLGMVVAAALLVFGAVFALRYLPARALDPDDASQMPVLDLLID